MLFNTLLVIVLSLSGVLSKSISLSVNPSSEIEEGSSVALTCSSDANPTVQNYTWFKNNTAVYSKTGGREDNYTIKNITLQDAGEYYCEAENANGTNRSPPKRLDVQFAPKNTSVSVSSSGEMVEGSSVILTCSSDANPPVQRYTWFKNNGDVSSEIGGPDDRYTIKHITLQDAGEYYCEAENAIGKNRSPPKHLDVQYAPKNTSVSVSPSGKILEGSLVNLTCSSVSNPPVQRYTWFKNNGDVSSEIGGPEDIYTIKNITLQDAGEYYCEAANAIGKNISLPERLDVQFAPKNTSVSVSSSGEMVEGSSVILTCSSDANPPVQNYTWYRKIGSAFSWRGTEWSYTIKNITLHDAGEYYCEAENAIGKNRSPPKHLDVQYSPKNTSVSVNHFSEIVEGSSVTLTCSSDANPPVQNYTWFKKNDTGVWQAGSGQSLNFSNFRSWNSGQYYCESQNRHGAQNSMGLTVRYAAAMTKNTYDLVYIITGTCALAGLLIVIACAACRRCGSAKETKLNTEDTACPVYANAPGGKTVSKAPPEERVTEKEEAAYSNVQRPDSQNQEEVQYAAVQKPVPQGEEDVQYASIQFSRSSAAPRSTEPALEDVIYSTAGNGNT